MAKFKADKTFKGTKENKLFKAGEPFDMTLKRAEEVQKNIKEKYNIDINFERLDASEDNADDKDGKEDQSEEK